MGYDGPSEMPGMMSAEQMKQLQEAQGSASTACSSRR